MRVAVSKFRPIFTRKFSSALYVTGDKAQENFTLLKPYINFEEQLQNRNALSDNIKARNLAIDLDRIEKKWNFYQVINDHKAVLEVTKERIGELIKELKKESEKNKVDIEMMISHSLQVKNDLKNVREYAYGIEESAVLSVLGLPNILHPRTPLGADEFVIHEFLEKPAEVTKPHLEIGKNLIEYVNPMMYYLKSDAAVFEFALSNYFCEAILEAGFTQFSNPHFARSLIVEGCGADYADASKVFTLSTPHNEKVHEISKIHLVGGASLYSFMAYFTKNLLQPHIFPLKIFSIGKTYQPLSTNCANHDLTTVTQNSVASIFVATLTDETEFLESIQEILIKLYESLGYHFKLTYNSASNLDKSESLRLSVQMFSNHSQKYIEVGNVSLFDDYLSKRLLFTYTENKERQFPKVIFGNLLNVQKFLSCALENNAPTKSPLLSDVLKKYL